MPSINMGPPELPLRLRKDKSVDERGTLGSGTPGIDTPNNDTPSNDTRGNDQSDYTSSDGESSGAHDYTPVYNEQGPPRMPVYSTGMSDEDTLTSINELLDGMTNKAAGTEPGPFSAQDRLSFLPDFCNRLDRIYRRDHGKPFDNKDCFDLRMLFSDPAQGLWPWMDLDPRDQAPDFMDLPTAKHLHTPMYEPVWQSPRYTSSGNTVAVLRTPGKSGLTLMPTTATTDLILALQSADAESHEESDEETVVLPSGADRSDSEETICTEDQIDEGLNPSFVTDKLVKLTMGLGAESLWKPEQIGAVDFGKVDTHWRVPSDLFMEVVEEKGAWAGGGASGEGPAKPKSKNARMKAARKAKKAAEKKAAAQK